MASHRTIAFHLSWIALVLTGARSSDLRDVPQPRDSASVTIVSSSSSNTLSKAPTDTFYLYGGPGTREGTFEGIHGIPLDRQGWIGVDRTDMPIFWQVSTFNSDNLGGHGSGNRAAWSGQSPAQRPGWLHTPGYGNDWNDILEFHSGPVGDPTVGQTVSLDFVFNHDLEPGHDNFDVEYESAGIWQTLLSVSGTDRDSTGSFPPGGTTFASAATTSIVYAGNDYGGANSNEVVLRIRVVTDQAGSDEDGLWPTLAGAAQVDDITVSWSDGTDFEDFESGSFDGRWIPRKTMFAGDFSKVWSKLEDGDLDPCVDNDTHLMGFIDAGQEIGNAASAALIPGYPTHTSGATSSQWNYGPGGWVTPIHGGVSENVRPPITPVPLHNEVWSPPIAWDLPGSDDDGPDVTGAILRMLVWEHLSIADGMFYDWHVRSSMDGTHWLPWRSQGYVYGGHRAWRSMQFDVSRLVPLHPQFVQIAVGAIDLSRLFFQGGLDSTPSPFFDNISLLKYRVGGPVISAFDGDLANDGFPVSGSIDASTRSARNALDIPLDMRSDIRGKRIPGIDPGDSLVVDAFSIVPTAALADLRLVWVLDRNPLFDDVRALPSRAVDQNVSSSMARWFGEVVAESVISSLGETVPDRFSFDLPDQDFFYPGDVLRYYVQATDTDGRISTLPTNISGFTEGVDYDSRFVVRGLPSLRDSTGTQPWLLIWSDVPRGSEEEALRSAMLPLALSSGLDFDTYSTQGGWWSNGLGSSGGHGATVDQIAGYQAILYDGGDKYLVLLNTGFSNGDKSDDIALLTAWHTLPGRRSIAYFGNNVASADDLEGSAKQIYRQDIMGVALVDDDVSDAIDGQFAPAVRPIDSAYSAQFVARGTCPKGNRFDQITPMPGATHAHGFVDLTNGLYPNVAASVIFDRLVNGDQKIDITFPFAFGVIHAPTSKAATNVRPSTLVLAETLNILRPGLYFPSIPVPTPEAQSISMTISPNPFNPRTTIRFAGLPEHAAGSVRLYSLRGELVATLVDGELGRDHFTWKGRDTRGRAVASGVYVVRAQMGDWSQQAKIALLK